MRQTLSNLANSQGSGGGGEPTPPTWDLNVPVTGNLIWSVNQKYDNIENPGTGDKSTWNYIQGSKALSYSATGGVISYNPTTGASTLQGGAYWKSTFNTNLNFNAGLEGFLVIKFNTLSSTAYLTHYGYQGTGSTRYIPSFKVETNGNCDFYGAHGIFLSGVKTWATSLTTGQFYVLNYGSTNNSTQTAFLYVNGVSAGIPSGGNALMSYSTLDRFSVGAAPDGINQNDIEVCEFLQYIPEISTANRTTMNNYLINKYGI